MQLCKYYSKVTVACFASNFGLGTVCNSMHIFLWTKKFDLSLCCAVRGFSTFGNVPAADLSEFTRHNIRQLISILEYRVVGACDVHHLSTFRRCEVTSLVVLQYSHVRVDVVVCHRAAVDKPPAAVIVHVHARCGIDYRLDRVARWTQ